MLTQGQNTFVRRPSDFSHVPGKPFIYSAPEQVFRCFREMPSFQSVGRPRVGMQTANNDLLLRRWSEVSLKNTNIANSRMREWVKYQKGGGYRRWFGNNEYILRYGGDGTPIIAQPNATLSEWSIAAHLKCTWSDITSGKPFATRLVPDDSFYDISGHCFFPEVASIDELMALTNSRPFGIIINLINPTIHFQVGDVGRIPTPVSKMPISCREIAAQCVSIARADWDNFETSWDFRDQPLLRPGLKGATLEASWRNWEAQSTAAIRRMQELETENNRLFIAAYGLDGELQPEVPEAQITLARAEARRDMAAFLSYAVGCMMGRYSPDLPGLILANAGDSLREFLEKVGKPLAELTFAPDADGIIPVLDGEWFEDDIVARTRDFLRATFGEATLRENLRFLEDSLGKDLRKYFLNDFYKDHLQTYKKRPIYWLVQSPKKSFSVLLYIHRYTRDTCNLILNNYLRSFLNKINSQLAHLQQTQAAASGSVRDKTAARKESDKLNKIRLECAEWERTTMLPLAQARTQLDLDDGVKINYLKLAEALAPIPGLAAAEE